MGACLSCLGLTSSPTSDPSSDRARLLYDDHHNVYGTWGGNTVPPPPDHGISAEEERRLQHAWDGITTWAGNQIVEIFPTNTQQHQPNMTQAAPMYDSDASEQGEVNGHGENGQKTAMEQQQHQDILLSMIPGDKSKRSIRIYPSSRPSSRQAGGGMEVNRKLKEKASGVFQKMDLGLS